MINIAPYRSKYEFDQAKRLIANKINFEYEHIQFSWIEDVINSVCGDCNSKNIKKSRKYTPDFFFPKSKLLIETKGKFTPENRKYMAQIIKQSPYPLRMVFMRDNWLTRKKSMSYSRWCDLNGIEWAIGNIPLEWVAKDKK